MASIAGRLMVDFVRQRTERCFAYRDCSFRLHPDATPVTPGVLPSRLDGLLQQSGRLIVMGFYALRVPCYRLVLEGM